MQVKNIDRRTFLEAAVLPMAVLGAQRAPQSSGHGIRVEHGLDRLDAPRRIAGANVVTCKVATQDIYGGLFRDRPAFQVDSSESSSLSG